MPGGFTELTKELSPAVVNISTAQTIEVNTEDVPAFPEGSPLERFNDFFGGGNESFIEMFEPFRRSNAL